VFEVSNGSCEPILDIYVPRDFQWYKKLLNPMGLNPCNCSMKIWESIETPTPKVGTHLGMWMFILSHSPTLLGAWNVTTNLHIWTQYLHLIETLLYNLLIRNFVKIMKTCNSSKIICLFCLFVTFKFPKAWWPPPPPPPPTRPTPPPHFLVFLKNLWKRHVPWSGFVMFRV